MSDALTQLQRLTSGHAYAPGGEPGFWLRVLDRLFGAGNEHYFFAIVCVATMVLAGAIARAGVRRREAERRRRLGLPETTTRSGAAPRAPGPAARGAGARADLAALRRARAIQTKSGIDGERA